MLNNSLSHLEDLFYLVKTNTLTSSTISDTVIGKGQSAVFFNTLTVLPGNIVKVGEGGILRGISTN